MHIMSSNQSKTIWIKNRQSNSSPPKKKQKPDTMKGDDRDSLGEFQSSIFDASDGHQLVDFIRKKKGLRVQPLKIFDDVPSDRRSLQIEIQQLNDKNDEEDRLEELESTMQPERHDEPVLTEVQIVQNDQEPNSSVNENSKNTHFSRRFSPKSPTHSLLRASLKNKTRSIGRRTLLKEFEKTLQESRFLPDTCSTPLNQDPLKNNTNAASVSNRIASIQPDNVTKDRSLNHNIQGIVNSPLIDSESDTSLTLQSNTPTTDRDTENEMRKLQEQNDMLLELVNSSKLPHNNSSDKENPAPTSPQLAPNNTERRRTYTVRRDSTIGNLILLSANKSKGQNAEHPSSPAVRAPQKLAAPASVQKTSRIPIITRVTSLNPKAMLMENPDNNSRQVTENQETSQIIEQLQKGNPSNVPVIVIPVNQTFNQAPPRRVSRPNSATFVNSPNSNEISSTTGPTVPQLYPNEPQTFTNEGTIPVNSLRLEDIITEDDNESCVDEPPRQRKRAQKGRPVKSSNKSQRVRELVSANELSKMNFSEILDLRKHNRSGDLRKDFNMTKRESIFFDKQLELEILRRSIQETNLESELLQLEELPAPPENFSDTHRKSKTFEQARPSVAASDLIDDSISDMISLSQTTNNRLQKSTGPRKRGRKKMSEQVNNYLRASERISKSKAKYIYCSKRKLYSKGNSDESSDYESPQKSYRRTQNDISNETVEHNDRVPAINNERIPVLLHNSPPSSQQTIFSESLHLEPPLQFSSAHCPPHSRRSSVPISSSRSISNLQGKYPSSLPSPQSSCRRNSRPQRRCSPSPDSSPTHHPFLPSSRPQRTSPPSSVPSSPHMSRNLRSSRQQRRSPPCAGSPQPHLSSSLRSSRKQRRFSLSPASPPHISRSLRNSRQQRRSPRPSPSTPPHITPSRGRSSTSSVPSKKSPSGRSSRNQSRTSSRQSPSRRSYRNQLTPPRPSSSAPPHISPSRQSFRNQRTSSRPSPSPPPHISPSRPRSSNSRQRSISSTSSGAPPSHSSPSRHNSPQHPTLTSEHPLNKPVDIANKSTPKIQDPINDEAIFKVPRGKPPKKKVAKQKPLDTSSSVDLNLLHTGSSSTETLPTVRRSGREKKPLTAYWSCSQTEFRPLFDLNKVYNKKKNAQIKRHANNEISAAKNLPSSVNNLVANTKTVESNSVKKAQGKGKKLSKKQQRELESLQAKQREQKENEVTSNLSHCPSFHSATSDSVKTSKKQAELQLTEERVSERSPSNEEDSKVERAHSKKAPSKSKKTKSSKSESADLKKRQPSTESKDEQVSTEKSKVAYDLKKSSNAKSGSKPKRLPKSAAAHENPPSASAIPSKNPVTITSDCKANPSVNPSDSYLSSVQALRLATIEEDSELEINYNITITASEKAQSGSHAKILPPATTSGDKRKKANKMHVKPNEDAFRKEHDESIADVSSVHVNSLFDQLKNSSMSGAATNVEGEEVHCSGQVSNVSQATQRNAKAMPNSKNFVVRLMRMKIVQNDEQVCDSGFSSEEAHSSRPKTKAYDGDILLKWLKNVISKSPTNTENSVARMLKSDGFHAANADDLVFQELDGVDYAFYDTESPFSFGYMRFNPKTSKKRCLAKKFELTLFVMCGTLEITVNSNIFPSKGGDLITVFKGARYGICNISNDPALVMVIKK